MSIRKIMAFGLAAAIGTATLVVETTPAMAGAGWSCGELWRMRNEIYARNGYCFETPRARAVFGRGCFPPYGQLRGWERRRVNEIQMWERENGC